MPRRVMWLLNHGTARRFELPMLRRAGFDEIFLPKRIPQEIGFRSGSVDWSEDAHLTIPRDALDKLNAADWYRGVDKDTWAVANEYFDTLFFIGYHSDIFSNVFRGFAGAAIWRTYGLLSSQRYSDAMKWFPGVEREVRDMGRRFWFGQGYGHLHEREDEFLSARRLDLPLGLTPPDTRPDAWTGRDARVLFVCPDLAANAYYGQTYRQFRQDFGDLPFAVGGAQSVAVPDARVLGFVPREEHDRHMREMRVMFYHSREPYHIHYHPLEAIAAGMPLVYMAGGLLDRLGGAGQPGRCLTTAQAHHKLSRILDGDEALISHIRARQTRILDSMDPQRCAPSWVEGMRRVALELEQALDKPPEGLRRRRRIAVMVPLDPRNASRQLPAARLLAQAIALGSEQHGEAAEVVMALVESSQTGGRNDERSDARHASEDQAPGGDTRQPGLAGAADPLPHNVSVRACRWRELTSVQARDAMRLSGVEAGATLPGYAVADDGARQLTDCDLWILCGAGIARPLLPLKPHLYQMRGDAHGEGAAQPAALSQADIDMARSARAVLAASPSARQESLQCAGVSPERLKAVPALATDMSNLRAQAAAWWLVIREYL